MDAQRLLDTIKTINSRKIPNNDVFWEGADLVITTKEPEPPTEKDDWLIHARYNRIVFVVTPRALELSWLVIELREIFSDEIDGINKMVFYPGLGNVMNEGLKKRDSLKTIMLHTVLQALLFWIIPPETRTKQEMVMKILEEKAGPVPTEEDDGITIGEILRAIEEGRPIAENRNKAMHNWMQKAMGKE